MNDLQLEISDGVDPDKMGVIAPGVMMTPAIGDEDYWFFRVKLNDSGQAILGFPKFGTIGVGFAQEEDWNSNLPYRAKDHNGKGRSTAQVIFDHVKHNKGDKSIPDERCLEAIQMVIDAAHRYQGTEPIAV